MTAEEIKDYVELTKQLEKETKEFKASIADLEKELKRKRDMFELSVQDRKKKKEKQEQLFLVKGEKILEKIEKFFYDKYPFRYSIYCKAANAFGITFTHEQKESITLGCTLTKIRKITNTYIIFDAKELEDEYSYLYGTVGIPIKFFEQPELLDDTTYLDEIITKINARLKKDQNVKKQKRIAELEAKLAELKGEA